MHLSPRRQSTVADLLRLLAGWLALVVVLQGVAAAHAMASGPLHVHASSAVLAAGTRALALPSTGLGESRPQMQARTHAHHHDAAQRHQHAAGDASVQTVPGADDAMDAAAFALTAALALLAVAVLRTGSDPRSHVLRCAGGWSLCLAWLAPLRRPPRRC
jgi:hypothetical protein